MLGLDLPPPLGRGKPRPEVVEPWLELVEELMGRGVRTPTELKKLVGVSHKTAARWMGEIQKRWTRGLTDDRINWRRETLYGEADSVARAAWADAMAADVTPSQRAALYKIVLLANQRKASLTGLDVMEVRVKKEVRHHTIVDMVARVETEHGLAPGALGAIGRQAAKALSGGALQLPAAAGAEPGAAEPGADGQARGAGGGGPEDADGGGEKGSFPTGGASRDVKVHGEIFFPAHEASNSSGEKTNCANLSGDVLEVSEVED